MKKLICVLAVLALIFTACTNNGENGTAENGTAENGVVEDGDGIIDENRDDTMTDDETAGQDVMDNVGESVDDLAEGATDATKEAADGVRNAVDSMTGNDK